MNGRAGWLRVCSDATLRNKLHQILFVHHFTKTIGNCALPLSSSSCCVGRCVLRIILAMSTYIPCSMFMSSCRFLVCISLAFTTPKKHSKWKRSTHIRRPPTIAAALTLSTRKNNARICDRMAFIRIAAGSINLHFRCSGRMTTDDHDDANDED